MPGQLTSTEKDALVRRLNSSNDAERQQAQTDLQALIAADVRRIRQCRTLQTVAIRLVGLVYLAAYIYFRLICHQPMADVFHLVALAGMGIGLVSRSRASNALHNILSLDIPQAASALLEGYNVGSGYAVGDTRQALIRLLPRLKAADAVLITPHQRKQIYAILSINERIPWNDTYATLELKIAALRALEQIGDEKAIPYVAKLACSARRPQVRAAAEECLPFLQQRAEQTRTEQTLLRAGTQPASPDTLLRSTNYATPTEPQQLLRASQTENNADAT